MCRNDRRDPGGLLGVGGCSHGDVDVDQTVLLSPDADERLPAVSSLPVWRAPGESQALTVPAGRARRRFGQHFLIDRMVVEDILGAIAPRPGERILEIGPGTGALTLGLAASGAEISAVEIDFEMAAITTARFPQVRLHCADILKIDLDQVFGGSSWRLVGNLPYNISTPLLIRLLDYGPNIQDALFLVQEEVALRLAAPEGSRARGRLGVMMGYGFASQLLFRVPPEAFRPVPKVQSRLVRLRPRPPPANPPSRESFALLVRTLFAQRRKTLANSIKALSLPPESGCRWPVGLAEANIDPGLRAEALSVQNFTALARYLDRAHRKLP